jgi:hypothetical protein
MLFAVVSDRGASVLLFGTETILTFCPLSGCN